MKPQGPITQLLELSLLASLASSPPHPLDDIGAEGVCAYNQCALREGKAAVGVVGVGVLIWKDITASSGLAVPFLGTYPVSYLSAGHTVFSQEIQAGHLIRLPKAITRGARQGSYHQFW